MTRSPLVILVLAVLLVGALTTAFGPPTVRAQEAEPEPTSLIEAILEDEELPIAPDYVRLLRITLEPGAKSPLHTHPGPEFGRVEAGTLRVLVQGKALILRAAAEGTPTPGIEEAPQSEEFILRRGDQIAYMPGTAMTFRNPGTRPAVILSAVILPAGHQHPPGQVWVGQAPSAEDLEGVTPQILGDGLAETLPEGQTVVAVDPITLGADEPIPAHTGPVLLSLADGALELTVTEGCAQVSRTAEPGPRPCAEAGTTFTLAVGDAVFFPTGVAEAARPNSGEIELLRLTIASTAPDAAATPVAGGVTVIEVTTPPEPTPEPTEEATAEPTEEATEEATEEPTAEATEAPTEEPSDEIAEGATVVTTDTGVRVRTGPTTDSEIVETLPDGYVLTVTGPSEEGGDFTWWPVVDPNNPAIAGYVAEEFIEVQQPEE